MLRNAPHRAEVHRRTPTRVGGQVVYEDVLVGTHRGRFDLYDAEGVEVADLPTTASSASFRMAHGADVVAGDKVRLLVPATPILAGDWEVTAVRWSPLALRALLRKA